MSEELQILDLPPDLAHHVQVLDLLPVEDLDRNLVPGQLVEADFHLAKGADAQGLAQDVMTNLNLEKSLKTSIRKIYMLCKQGRLETGVHSVT